MGADVIVRTYLAPRRAEFLTSHKLDVFATVVPPARAIRELVAVRIARCDPDRRPAGLTRLR